jgi:hypothetical protein
LDRDLGADAALGVEVVEHRLQIREALQRSLLACLLLVPGEEIPPGKRSRWMDYTLREVEIMFFHHRLLGLAGAHRSRSLCLRSGVAGRRGELA